jgi:Membrane domain of glycerophosphoryl diester phosphodiesterase
VRTGAVLGDTWTIYKGLFGQTVLTGGLVFAALGLLDAALAAGPAHGLRIVLTPLAVALPVVGTSLVQGALIEAVDDERNGITRASVLELYRNAWQKIGALLAVALLTGLGVGLGLLLLVVPGVVLAVRWSLAVPIVMLEHASARAAMRRSRELVRGHGWRVLRVLVYAGIISGAVSFVIRLLAVAMLGHEHRSLATWVGVTFGGAVAAPYVSHALSVVYYRLADPDRPVIAARPTRWGSIWDEPTA